MLLGQGFELKHSTLRRGKNISPTFTLIYIYIYTFWVNYIKGILDFFFLNRFDKYYHWLYLCQLHLQNNFNKCILTYFIIFFFLVFQTFAWILNNFNQSIYFCQDIWYFRYIYKIKYWYIWIYRYLWHICL